MYVYMYIYVYTYIHTPVRIIILHAMCDMLYCIVAALPYTANTTVSCSTWCSPQDIIARARFQCCGSIVICFAFSPLGRYPVVPIINDCTPNIQTRLKRW